MLWRAVYFACFLLLAGFYHGLLSVAPAVDGATAPPWWVPQDLRAQWDQLSELMEFVRSQASLRTLVAALLMVPPLGMGGLGLWLFERTQPVARCAGIAIALLVWWRKPDAPASPAFLITALALGFLALSAPGSVSPLGEA